MLKFEVCTNVYGFFFNELILICDLVTIRFVDLLDVFFNYFKENLWELLIVVKWLSSVRKYGLYL